MFSNVQRRSCRSSGGSALENKPLQVYMFPLSLSLYLSLSCSIQCAIHAAHSSLVGSPRRTKWSHRQITVVSNAFPAAMSDQSQHVAHGHATGNTRVPLRRGYCCSLATKHIRTITRRYPPTHTQVSETSFQQQGARLPQKSSGGQTQICWTFACACRGQSTYVHACTRQQGKSSDLRMPRTQPKFVEKLLNFPGIEMPECMLQLRFDC